MKTSVVWKIGMEFDGTSDGNTVHMDTKAPLGKNSGATPKELVAMGLGGCTAMDVIALLKKHKQDCKTLMVDVDIEKSTARQPSVFTSAKLTFDATGEMDPAILLESVRLSQTKYCGVSAMLVKAFPITYVVRLNGEQIGEGTTEF